MENDFDIPVFVPIEDSITDLEKNTAEFIFTMALERFVNTMRVVKQLGGEDPYVSKFDGTPLFVNFGGSSHITEDQANVIIRNDVTSNWRSSFFFTNELFINLDDYYKRKGKIGMPDLTDDNFAHTFKSMRNHLVRAVNDINEKIESKEPLAIDLLIQFSGEIELEIAIWTIGTQNAIKLTNIDISRRIESNEGEKSIRTILNKISLELINIGFPSSNFTDKVHEYIEKLIHMKYATNTWLPRRISALITTVFNITIEVHVLLNVLKKMFNSKINISEATKLVKNGLEFLSDQSKKHIEILSGNLINTATTRKKMYNTLIDKYLSLRNNNEPEFETTFGSLPIEMVEKILNPFTIFNTEPSMVKMNIFIVLYHTRIHDNIQTIRNDKQNKWIGRLSMFDSPLKNFFDVFFVLSSIKKLSLCVETIRQTVNTKEKRSDRILLASQLLKATAISEQNGFDMHGNPSYIFHRNCYDQGISFMDEISSVLTNKNVKNIIDAFLSFVYDDEAPSWASKTLWNLEKKKYAANIDIIKHGFIDNQGARHSGMRTKEEAQLELENNISVIMGTISSARTEMDRDYNEIFRLDETIKNEEDIDDKSHSLKRKRHVGFDIRQDFIQRYFPLMLLSQVRDEQHLVTKSKKNENLMDNFFF